MITIPFTAVVSGLIVAVVPPTRVTEVEANSSAQEGLQRPAVIHVRSFSISKSAANPENTDGGGRPHLLGILRGGEENTVIGQHREQQQEDTLAKLPGLLQQALIRNLSISVAPADNGDGAYASRDSWVVTGEFVEVDAGNRAMQATARGEQGCPSDRERDREIHGRSGNPHAEVHTIQVDGSVQARLAACDRAV